MQAILHGRVHIAKAINATAIALEDTPCYVESDRCADRK
jgi:glutathione-independent formaldehyde dehydrogenase